MKQGKLDVMKEGKRVYYIKGGLILNAFIKTVYRNNSIVLSDGSFFKIMEVYGNKNDAILALQEQNGEAKKRKT